MKILTPVCWQSTFVDEVAHFDMAAHEWHSDGETIPKSPHCPVFAVYHPVQRKRPLLTPQTSFIIKETCKRVALSTVHLEDFLANIDTMVFYQYHKAIRTTIECPGHSHRDAVEVAIYKQGYRVGQARSQA